MHDVLRMLRLGVVAAALASGCNQLPDVPGMLEGDWNPPVFVRTRVVGQAEIVLVFDEPVELLDFAGHAALELNQTATTALARELTLRFSKPLDAGNRYWVSVTVADEHGNRSTVHTPFYGLNERVPRILINEFVCEGSSKNPDWVELVVLSDGNLGGVTLTEGSPSFWESRKILPAVEVVAGDYVLVHFKPQAIPEEIDETVDKAASRGRNHSLVAWDFWVIGGDGIPNTTGALTLSASPEGEVLDAVLYSNRKYEATHQRRGFGTQRQLEMFEEIGKLDAWVTQGEFVIPEDGIDPTDSTATRSLSRSADHGDSDSARDWHVVPTRGATPGAVNTDDVYRASR